MDIDTIEAVLAIEAVPEKPEPQRKLKTDAWKDEVRGHFNELREALRANAKVPAPIQLLETYPSEEVEALHKEIASLKSQLVVCREALNTIGIDCYKAPEQLPWLAEAIRSELDVARGLELKEERVEPAGTAGLDSFIRGKS